MVHENVIRANEIVGNDIVKALKRRGFGAEYVATSEQALARVMEIIPADATVGIPGTITVRDIGALDALKARGNTVYQHWGKMSNEERRAARFKENTADVFLTSANAVTRDGRIINIATEQETESREWLGETALCFSLWASTNLPSTLRTD